MEKGKKKEKDERAAHTEYIQRVLRGLVVGESLGITGNYAEFALFYFLLRASDIWSIFWRYRSIPNSAMHSRQEQLFSALLLVV